MCAEAWCRRDGVGCDGSARAGQRRRVGGSGAQGWVGASNSRMRAERNQDAWPNLVQGCEPNLVKSKYEILQPATGHGRLQAESFYPIVIGGICRVLAF